MMTDPTKEQIRQIILEVVAAELQLPIEALPSNISIGHSTSDSRRREILRTIEERLGIVVHDGIHCSGHGHIEFVIYYYTCIFYPPSIFNPPRPPR